MTDLPTPQALAATPDTRLSAMVFTRDPDADRVIRDCLANVVPSAQFISGTVDTAVSELAQRASPRLLLVDVSGCTDPVARVNSLAQSCEPGTGAIVIGDTNDIRLYRELASLGVI